MEWAAALEWPDGDSVAPGIEPGREARARESNMDYSREQISGDRVFSTGRVALLLTLGSLALLAFTHAEATGDDRYGKVELEAKSQFSLVRIRTKGSLRAMMFVRDSGQEVVESMLDLSKPHELQVPYTRYMFLSYLFQPKQESALMIGLGGGSMVHFMNHYDPAVKLDVVEIDPKIVEIAEKMFGVKSEGNVNVQVADGLEYLRTTEKKYDAIYMDAFLKPSRDTDNTGVPLRLKTANFYRGLQARLNPGGVLMINVNMHERINEDLKTIESAFPYVYVFKAPGSLNYVVAASTIKFKFADLTANAEKIDQRFRTSYSFRQMALNKVE